VVELCVTEQGQVAEARIIRSAGSKIDPLVLEALARWRYRPLVRDGEPTSFCTTVRYEVSGQLG
jgi:TonB family protein